jgi:CubicO group peptidase (beta-lactamase class C family)
MTSFKISTSDTNDSWTKLKLDDNDSEDWVKAINIFKDRFETRFFKPIEALITHTDIKIKVYSGFTILSLDCLIIETLNQFYHGIEDSEEKFKSNCRSYKDFFNRSEFFNKDFDTNEKISLFYHHIRCGLLHQAETKEFSKINLKNPNLVSLIDIGGAKSGFNGNIILLDDGKVIYKKCLGYANFDTKEFLNDSSVFELASCTKQFTGMAIMMLAEQGKLNYSDTLQKFIPNLPYKNITIENLLTHTAGLSEYEPIMRSHWDNRETATNYDVLDVFKKFKPEINQEPNKKFEYSNTGYALLSIIIENASGMTYTKYLDENIFKRLGMKHTFVCSAYLSKDKKIANYANGYNFGNSGKYILVDSLERVQNNLWLGGITGDRAVHSTILDLAIWDKALRKNILVKKVTLNKAFAPFVLKDGKETDYGFGQFIVRGNKNGKAVYHSGGWPGYRTAILHFIDAKTTIVALSNNEFNNTTKLVGKISLIHFGK